MKKEYESEMEIKWEIWFMLATKTKELLSVFLLLPWISLYKTWLDLDFIYFFAQIFLSFDVISFK